MPNVFSRLRQRMPQTESLPSSQAPFVRNSSSPRARPSSERQSSSRNWGPRASTYASNMARRSTDNQHSLGPARALSREEQEKQQKPAGLDQPWLVLQRSLFSSWVNVLLLLVPVGIASHPAKFPEVLGYATEQLALHLGDTLGGLLNATFGNAVELLVGILALVKGKIEIVQTSLVGSILSNLLLVGGCCFLFGGIKNNEQVFNTHAAQSYGSLLAMAILSTLLPAAYNSLHAKDTELKSGTLTLSHVTAIFLLVIYIAYLFFQLKTHANLFLAVPMHERRVAALKPGKAVADEENDIGTPQGEVTATATTAHSPAPGSPPLNQDTAVVFSNQTAEVPGAARNRKDTLEACEEAGLNEGDDDEEELPELTTTAAIVLLLGITALTSVCAEFLVDSIDGLTTKWNLSSSFVGMILLPIVGNAAEHVTAVTVAIRNKMDLALGVAVGSSIQIALFVMPFLCILGWIIGQPMTIYFSPFTTVVLFVTVLLVNYIIGDGRTNWLEGLVLIMAYAIIGVAYFLYPKNMDTSSTSL